MSRFDARRRRFAAGARAGYTLVEVMLALGVLAVGATAILGLQQAAIRGNQEANEYATATRVAELWLERFRMDSLSWTTGGSNAVPSPTLLANTQLMQGLTGPGTTGWFQPVVAAPAAFPAASQLSMHGNPLPAPGPPIPVFCTQANLTWVYNSTALRADVRVFWPRRDWIAGANRLGCPAVPDPFQYHMVSASTLLRWTPAQPRRRT